MKKALRIAAFVVLGLVALLCTAVLIGPPKVPKEAIATKVLRDPALMAEAFALPVAASYGKQLDFQRNGSVCGPASLRNVLRSLHEPVGDEGAVVAGTGKCQLFGFCVMGLTLDELAQVARARTQRPVHVLRNLTQAQFREHMKKSNDPRYRYIVNFTRKAIFGAGGGHHSPIGGYLPAHDLVLVLDVNRDFGPWLIETARLFAATDTIDGSSDAKRGLLRID